MTSRESRLAWAGGIAMFLLLAMVSVGLPIFFRVTETHPTPAQWATYQQNLLRWESSPGYVACAHAKDQEDCFAHLTKPTP